MDLKRLFTDDKAVSPVIGVILMVAITVILAAVIGAFVLDLGGNTQDTPQASFDYDYSSSSEVTITHESGDSLEADNLAVNIGGDEISTSTNSGDFDPSSGSEVNAGNTLVSSVGYDGTYGSGSGTTIRVIWNAPSGDSSSTLVSQDAP
ncbi:type IV pilin [Halobacteriales archaeon QS_9_68_17]|nr:MAG: type IV pilin [Halobacteriales archaeon QS_9_68_17]